MLTIISLCELNYSFKEERLEQHKCDKTFGTFGAPILLKADEDYCVVGILVGLSDVDNLGIAVTCSAFHE